MTEMYKLGIIECLVQAAGPGLWPGLWENSQDGALRAPGPSCAGPTRWNSPAGALSGDRPTV
jgi:hypothetical protein